MRTTKAKSANAATTKRTSKANAEVKLNAEALKIVHNKALTRADKVRGLLKQKPRIEGHAIAKALKTFYGYISRVQKVDAAKREAKKGK